MIDRQSSSTLRDLRNHPGLPQVMLIPGGVAIVMGMSGPFGTYSTMRLGDAGRDSETASLPTVMTDEIPVSRTYMGAFCKSDLMPCSGTPAGAGNG